MLKKVKLRTVAQILLYFVGVSVLFKYLYTHGYLIRHKFIQTHTETMMVIYLSHKVNYTTATCSNIYKSLQKSEKKSFLSTNKTLNLHSNKSIFAK